MLLQGSVLKFNFYEFWLGLWFPGSAKKYHEFHYCSRFKYFQNQKYVKPKMWKPMCSSGCVTECNVQFLGGLRQ